MQQKSYSILFILNRYPGIGGIENVTTFLANHFVEKYSYKVTILSVFAQKNIIRDIRLNKAIDIHVLQNRGGKDEQTEIVRKIIEKNKVTHVIYQDSYSPTLYLLDRVDRNKIKIIVAEHNTPDALVKDKIVEFLTSPLNCKRNIIRKVMFPFLYIKNVREVVGHHKAAYNVCDRYVLLSSKYMDMVERMIKEPFVKGTWINNPVTIERPDMSYEQLFSKKKNEALFICRLSTQKGVNYLMKIWEKFEKLYPDWRLRIVGDGSEKAYMERFVSKNGLKNVIFEGFQTDTARYYLQAKLLLVTSRFEGWSLNITEAQIFGCVPVVFNSYRSVYDIISDGDDGFIIKAFDTDAFVAKMVMAANNKSILSKMSVSAIKNTKRFSMDSIGIKWKTLIEKTTHINENSAD